MSLFQPYWWFATWVTSKRAGALSLLQIVVILLLLVVIGVCAYWIGKVVVG